MRNEPTSPPDRSKSLVVLVWGGEPAAIAALLEPLDDRVVALCAGAERVPGARDAAPGLSIGDANRWRLGPDIGIDGERFVAEPGTLSFDQLAEMVADFFGPRGSVVVLAPESEVSHRGLRLVRSSGGWTFDASPPSTADFEKSPKFSDSDVALEPKTPRISAADAVLAPREAAVELQRIARSPKHPSLPSALLEQLWVEVRSHTGADPHAYKSTTRGRRVARRMVLRRVDGLEAYLDLCRAQPEEFEALARDLLIPVTRFFRDPDAFAALSVALAPLVSAKPSEEPIRAWVPACATGEEAYSIAALLCDLVGPERVILYGTDLDADAIAYARRGLYTASAVAELSPAMREAYFVPDKEHFLVAKTLRDRVVFATQDVLADPPFSRLSLITCRNLLIYLEPEAQAQVLRTFHFALERKGLLFLGKSESPGRLDHLFAPVAKSFRVYRRREVPAEPLGPRRYRRWNRAAPVRRSERSAVSAADAAAHALAELVPDPAVLVDQSRQILFVRGDVTDYLTIGEGDRPLAITELAVPDLQAALRGALFRAARDALPISKLGVRVRTRRGVERVVDILVRPVAEHRGPEGALLVVFEERPSSEAEADRHEENPERLRELAEELALLQENLDDSVEELEAANLDLRQLNQELSSSNEELQSANEEFETANEELQCANEQLQRLNEELELRRAQLGDANAELETLLEHAPTGLISVDSELRLRRYSRIAADRFRLTAESRGLPLSGLGDRPLLSALLPFLREALEREEPVERDVSVAGRRWRARVEPLPAGAGALLFSEDITDASRWAHEFASLVENAPDVVARFDRDGRHLYVNRALEQFTGRPKEEWFGKSNRELGLGEELCRTIETAIEAVFSTGRPMSARFCHVGPAGEMVLDARLVPELDPHGSVETVLSISRDITAEREAEDRLKAEKERTERILDSVSEGFMTLDQDLVLTHWNEAAARLLGRSSDEIIGRPLFESFPDAKGSVFEESYRRALATQQPDSFETYFAPFAEWFDVRVYPLDGGIAVHFHIVTDRKREEQERSELERELSHARKLQALGTLSGGVAHEFNNVLMTILGFTEVVLDDADTAATTRADLQEVLTAVRRGKTLVEQILAYSRKTPSSPRVLDLSEPVNRMVAILRRTLPKDIELEVRIETEVPLVRADASQIEQILLNLASNARDALSGPGTIRFELAVDPEDSSWVNLTVTDDGSGMDEATLARVFDPFFTTKPIGSGTGLGLSMVHGLVELNGGQVRCESWVGEGTRFTIAFPGADSPLTLPTPNVAPKLELLSEGSKPPILVVDDEPLLRTYYQRILVSSGYPVLTADSGERALEVLAAHTELELVVLDLGMPGMGGLSCLEQIRALRPTLPVIVATGYGQQAVARLPEGVGILAKPFRKLELLVAVQTALDPVSGAPLDAPPSGSG